MTVVQTVIEEDQLVLSQLPDSLLNAVPALEIYAFLSSEGIDFPGRYRGEEKIYNY